MKHFRVANSPVKLVAAAIGAGSIAVMLAACGRSPETPAAAPPPAQSANGAQTAPSGTTMEPPDAAAGEAAQAARMQAAQSWEPSALDELLAPIALYPDALVGQILAASTNAQEVLDAGNWLLDNQDLKGAQLDAAAGKLGFGPAVRALVQFPSVVDMMCTQLDWTREVGQAFTADQQGVLDSIQRLRTQAAAVGNLESTPQQKVEKKAEQGKEVIVVEPADPQVVYVPQYNPQVVYTTPPPAPAAPATTTVVTDGDDTGNMIAAGLIGFTAGIVLNEAFDDHDDYYYPHWGGGAVYYPPPYRPVYPGYRPAGAYAPPANYRHSYNQINGDVNINVGNDDYFNRATHNQRAVNLRTTDTQEWRGQSTYAGSRTGAQERAAQRNPVASGNERVATQEKRGDSSQYRGISNERASGQSPRPEDYRGSREYRGEQPNDRRAASGEYRGNAARDGTAGLRAADERAQRSGEDVAAAASRENAERRAARAADTSAYPPRADRGFETGGSASERGDRAVSTGRLDSAQSSGALSNVSRGSREHAASQRGHQSAGNHPRRGR